jgi:uncharacterized protein (TIGR03790 family)
MSTCVLLLLATIGAGETKMDTPGIEKDRFGVTAAGIPVDRYTLRNGRGLSVRLITYGATVTELLAPDRQGRAADVVLGFDNLAQYETQSPYFGCTVGRVAFRIAGAEFTLDGKQYRLTRNIPPHHMHGGKHGFNKVVWNAEPLPDPRTPAVRFTHDSPAGDQGYPGALHVAVVYSLTEDNGLKIDYTGTADRPTPLNLTHHGYFNLAGAGAGDIRGHVLEVAASRYVPLDKQGFPAGPATPVSGTTFDFRQPTAVGARMKPGSPMENGCDMSCLIDRKDSGLVRAAVLSEPASGRVMEVFTTEPSLVVYSGNGLDGTLRGKHGVVYGKHGGICLETAHVPDSVHHPEFPSIILRPGQIYRQVCVYRFSAVAPAGDSPDFRGATRSVGPKMGLSPLRANPADRVVIVRNESSPISRAVADDYARRRSVKNVLRVRCQDSAVKPENETIPYAIFRKAIEEPLAGFLTTHQGIDFIVLTKGIPIRIEGATGRGLGNCRPSLDSYLAALDYDKTRGAVAVHLSDSGFTGTAWANRFWQSIEPFSHTKFGGYLVTRLDGYTEADAKALTACALAAERSAGKLPQGEVLLDTCPAFGYADRRRQPCPIFTSPPRAGVQQSLAELNFNQYNADMQSAADILRARHLPVELEQSDAFVASRQPLAGYVSWGSNDRHYNAGAYHSLRFQPGALCETAVSTSARTFLPTSGGQSLIADLIAQGATGAKGYSDEPLLQAVASPSVLFERYTRGWTLAESFYAASRFVGWEDIILGDPLCRPYGEKRNLPRYSSGSR